MITDFNMPGLNGFELLIEIESHHPKIAAVIITADPLQLANQTRYHVIEKEPGFIIKLIAYIQNALDK